jgi:hypothetical protein
MVSQTVEAKEESNEGDSDEGQPECGFSIVALRWWIDGVTPPDGSDLRGL